MNMLDEIALANWAKERGISYEEAFAIFDQSEDDDDAERIYLERKKQKESPLSFINCFANLWRHRRSRT